MGLPEDVGLAVQSNLAVIMTLSTQIDCLEKRLQEKVGQRPEFGLNGHSGLATWATAPRRFTVAPSLRS